MTLVLNGKGLVLEGPRLKIEDKQVPGRFAISHINCSRISFVTGMAKMISTSEGRAAGCLCWCTPPKHNKLIPQN